MNAEIVNLNESIYSPYLATSSSLKHLHEPLKKLFSQPRMIEDLLRGFVSQPWVNELDFSTLEKLNPHFITRTLRWRQSDLIWRVQLREHWLYVVLLLEFQSRAERFMPLRMLAYLCLFYLELVEQKQLTVNNKLPPVLPLVLYNGDQRWNYAAELSALLETLPGLAPYQPRFEFLLLDEGRYGESELRLPHNMVAALFRLEHSREPEDILAVLRAVIQVLQTGTDSDLDTAFLAWLKSLLVRAQFPEQQLDEIDRLYEVESMLAERMRVWTEGWKQQGFEQGIEQGIEQGLGAERALLYRLTYRRFGEGIAEQLKPLLENVHDTEILATIGEFIVDNTDGNELLQRVQVLLKSAE